MKYKIVYISVALLLVFISIGLGQVTVPKNRYHQHLESIEKPACEHTNDSFCTHLPLINIQTDAPIPEPFAKVNGERVRNDEMVATSVEYFDSQTKNNHLSDKPTVTSRALIRTRGRTSRSFEKHGYFLKFMEEDFLNNKKISLSGMAADSDWVLHGPYIDKTLIRNYLCYNLSGEIMDYSPNVRFCEIFINGEYEGLYLLTEKIEFNKEGRISLNQSDPDLRSTSYILKLDAGSDDPFYNLHTFSYYTKKNRGNSASGNLEILYPNATLTQTQKKYIETDISSFEKALTSFDSADRKHGYPAFLDVNAFVDYFIINEFTMNSDAARLSTYYYKDIRGKLGISVWDFNNAFDNYVPIMSQPHYFMMTDKFWYEYLLRDHTFCNKIIFRYRELRKSYLSDEYLLQYIDDTIAYLGDAIDRNNERWGHVYTPEYDFLKPAGRNPRSYEQAVMQLKNIIVERGAYLDKNIINLKSLSHDSINKQFNQQAGE